MRLIEEESSLSSPQNIQADGSRARSRYFGYAWLCILGVCLVIAAYNAYQKASMVEEYAYSCDPFGYLNTAKEIRQAVDRREAPTFWVETPKTKLLINYLQSNKVPLRLWLDFVAPLAYHYFPKSGHIGCQYPPGTGLVLAMFPEGKAVVRLNKAVIALLLLTGLAALVVAGIRQLRVSAGFVALAMYLGLRIIGRIGSWSFSINAALPAILLTIVCLFGAIWLATGRDKLRHAWLLSLLGGLFFGLGILIRLPVAFLGLGPFALLWPESWRISVRNRFVPFGIGVTVAGVLPVLAFQQYETGAWYLPSYAPWDTTPPGLQWLKANFSYYLGTGRGSTDNWALIVSIIGLGALLLFTTKKYRTGLDLTWIRLIGSTLLLWGTPTAYFLTHRTTIPYYSVPGTFGALLLLAFGVFTLEYFSIGSDVRAPVTKRASLRWIALILSFLPGAIVIAGGWPPSRPAMVHAGGPRPRAHQLVLPPRLADERAWIWADFLTGTLWYYGHKPGFKIATTDSATRAMVYRFVFERGEPQYLIQDSPYMKSIMDEISGMGGILEPIAGGVDGAPYFLIHWPKDGPIAPGQTNPAATDAPGNRQNN